MRSQLLASLTSKLVAGVAATTLAAGSLGAVAMTTVSSERDGVDEVAPALDGADGSVTCDTDDGSLPVFEEQVDTDDGGGVDGDPCDDGSGDDGSGDDGSGDDGSGDDGSGEDGSGEEFDAPVTLEEAVACAGDLADSPTFGAYVKELRHECGYKGGVSELAHERNRLRKEAKAAEREARDEERSADDAHEADEDESEESDEDEADETDEDEADELDESESESDGDEDESESDEDEADDSEGDESESDEDEADETEDSEGDESESAGSGGHGRGHAKKR